MLTYYRYLTVDYEKGNFSVSQCLWNDGAVSNIAAVISSADATNSSLSITGEEKSSSTSVSPGVIAGIVVGVVAIIAIVLLAFFIFRRRKRPTSKTPTDIVALAALDKVKADEDKMSIDPGSPLPGYKKTDLAGSLYRSSSFVDGELGTSGEIHQLPEAHHTNEDDYSTTARRMESERRANGTVELGGRAMMYEVMGDLPTPVEMDDHNSREGLLLSPSRAASANQSRPTSKGSEKSRVTGPVSAYLNG